MITRFLSMRLIPAFALVLLAATIGVGQSTSGSITGTVKDGAGAPVPDANVMVTNPATNLTRKVTTNSAGIFTAAQLPPGNYTIAVEKTGFKKLEKTNIMLNAIDLVNAGDFTLDVGAVTDTVTVSAETARIEIQSETGERSGVVTGNQIKDLSLNGRNYQDFLRTLPGVITGTVTGSQTSSSTGRLGDYSVNGTRTNQKELTVDGSSNIDTGNNVDTHASLNPDAIAEVKVLTSNFQAEYGRAGGAFISVVSKSGTREFHGGGRYFYRNEGLNANNYFRNAQQTDAFRNNGKSARPFYRYANAGYDIGGPVYLPFLAFNKEKNKLFFYWNQEWYEQLVPEGVRNIRVPTQLERNGDFSQTTDGNGVPVTILNPFTRQPYPGNRVPQNEWFSSGQAILNLYPLPNVSGNSQFNFTSSVSTKYPRREDILRMDYNITDRTRLSARYTNNAEKRLLAYGSFASDLNFPFAPISFPRPGRNGVLTLTHTFSPTLTNEFIFGPSSNFIELKPDGDKALASTNNINVPKLFPGIGAGYVPNFRFGGINNQTFPFTNYNGLPFINQNHTFNFIDNVSKIIGSHSIKAGFYAQRSRKDQTAFARTDGDINFNNDTNHPLNTGHPYSNALLGIYNNYTQANAFPKGLYRYWNIEGYIQDNWKATRRLTLDYGLRVSWYESQYDRLLQTGAFNPSEYSRSRASRLYFPICLSFNAQGACTNRRAVDPALQVPGFTPTLTNTLPPNFIAAFVPGTGDLANGIGQASKGYPRGGYDNRGPQWGPRLGFAYDLSGNGKTVIRGGAGISYDRVQGNIAFDQIANPPVVLQPQLLFGRLQDLTPGQSGLLAPSNVVGYAREGFLPTIYSMSLGVQRDIGYNTVIDVSYVGTLSRHLFLARELNAIPFGFLFTKAAQDPSLYPGNVVPDSDPSIPQVYRDAGLKFDGTKALTANLIRPFPGLGGIRYEENVATSNFNSLQVSVNRRFSRGFSYSLAYTWSKALGVAPGDGSFVNPYNTRLYDYRLLDFDRAHSFTATYIYDVPKLGRKLGDNWFTRGLLDGWQVSGITSLISGNPFELGVGIGGGVNANQRITGSWTEPSRFRLKGDPKNGPNGLLIDPNSFIIPEIGSLGLGERTYLRNPGINNTDLSLFKNFYIGDPDKGRQIQLRLEAYNIFNHTQFAGINAGTALSLPTGASNASIFGTTTSNPYSTLVITNNLRNGPVEGSNIPLGQRFGEYNGARDPRTIQLGVKIYF
ncbi:MAG TPA: carboxypeptidase regulatory-like domain-containing protein [Blastocatellia bacterium]|nr:carboxypeptidase regulatory-like domain-containing protein [Blastocatellia bacterium]